MVERWTWPAYVGVLIGALLFALVLVPLLLWQTRRYGKVSGLRVFASAALAIYAVALLAYTLLPLPAGDLAAWCARYAVPGPNFNPLLLVSDITNYATQHGVGATLTSPALLQGVANVVLFIPWGLLARRYFGVGVLAATVSALLASLLIETTQYTGIFGMIPCSYRYADIDDVITNTLGALIGAVIAPNLLGWLPQAQYLEEHPASARPVATPRRWLGMVADGLAYLGLGTVLGTVLDLGWRATGASGDPPGWLGIVVGTVVPLLAVFAVPLVNRYGTSIGQKLVWLRPRNLDWSPPTARQRTWAFALGGGAWATLQLLAELIEAPTASGLVSMLVWVVAAVLVLAVPITHGQGLAARVGRYQMVDSRAKPE